MTVKVEVIEGGVPHPKIMVAGLVCTIVCLYLSYLNVYTNTAMFSFFGGLAVIAALIWGSNTIKVLCSYGIGTGVPSAGMIAFGSGVIAMLLATKFGIAAPIVALVLAAVIGLILGYLANDVLNMKIPVMIQSLTELAVVGALTLMGFAVLITGQLHVHRPDQRNRYAVWCAVHAQLPGLVHRRRTYGRCIPARGNRNPAPVQRVPGTRLETGPDAHAHRRVRIFEHDRGSHHVVCPHQCRISHHLAHHCTDRMGIHLLRVHQTLEARCIRMA